MSAVRNAEVCQIVNRSHALSLIHSLVTLVLLAHNFILVV